MARLHLHPDRLEIALTPAEKLLALRKSDVVVPREAIRSATITDDPWIWVRGIRAPGTAIPLNLAVGQWKFHGGKDFLVIKGTKAAVVIDVEGEEFSRVIVTTAHAHELVGALRLEERTAKKPRTRTAKPQQQPGARKAAKAAADKAASDQAEKPATDTKTPAKAPAKTATKPAAKTPTKTAAKPATTRSRASDTAADKPAADKPTPAKRTTARKPDETSSATVAPQPSTKRPAATRKDTEAPTD